MKKIAVLLFALSLNTQSWAGETQVAVAANFIGAAKEIGKAFHDATGNEVKFSSGSTGKLYAQIVNGAPFDVMLSADSARPQRLEQEGYAVSGSRFTYAIGQLVLWSPRPGLVDAQGAVLRSNSYSHLAIANPKTAPYGAAAQQVMEKLGVWGEVQGRLVRAENISQCYQFVTSGNADLGFIALSQFKARKSHDGSSWEVPADLHQPLQQDAVLLKHGADNAVARAFLDFLLTPAAKKIITGEGYATE